MQYWLLKSEPDTFSIYDLAKAKGQTECWDGVRNYQARNFMRNDMQINDKAFFYHSNCKPPGIIGTVTIVKTSYPDYTSWDPKSENFDPKSKKDNPRWFMVDIKLDTIFEELIPLEKLKTIPNLKDMRLLQRGNRLSITPISSKEWNSILKLSKY